MTQARFHAPFRDPPVGGGVWRRVITPRAGTLLLDTATARDVWVIRGTDRRRPELPEPEAVWGKRLQDVLQAYLERRGFDRTGGIA